MNEPQFVPLVKENMTSKSSTKKFYANPEFQTAPNPADLPIPIMPQTPSKSKGKTEELKGLLKL